MKYIELDAKKIKKMSIKKRDENYDFRAFLKMQDSDKVDKIVHRLNKEISSQINCLDCGRCCTILTTGVSGSEIERLSKIDNLTKSEFESLYVDKDELDGAKYLKDLPCKYLSDKKCTIYSDRPKECKSYPHLHKVNFTSRTLGVIENYEICPIVFNVYEELKSEMNYRHW